MTDEPKIQKKPPKILVVDDSAIMRLIIRKMLEEDGYLVLEATNGKEAVQTYRKHKPNLVLMDISMPGLDGINATQKIVKYDEDAIIIMVSAMRQRAHVVEAIIKGASDYIIKPIDAERLLQSIHKKVPPPIKAPRKKEKKSAAKEKEGIKILIVEDRPMNQKLVATMLEKKGWKAMVASNGQEALEILEKDDFSLILMDLEMPEMDGYEATKEIRKREKEKEKKRAMPIIAMTAHDKEEYITKALEVGMESHIVKPIDTGILYTTIEENLKRMEEEKKKEEEEREKKEREAKAKEEEEVKEEKEKKKSEPPFDVKRVKEDLGGDEAVLQEMVQVFFKGFNEEFDNLHKAVKEKDSETTLKIAHSLKGELGNLRAQGAFVLAAQLVDMAEKKDLNKAEDLLIRLLKKVDEIKDFTAEDNWQKQE